MSKNASIPALIELSLSAGHTKLSQDGALVRQTGTFTGRAAKDKFILKDELTTEGVEWGKVNQPIDRKTYQKLRERVLNFLKERETHVVDVSVGAHKAYSQNIKVHCEMPHQALFAKTMFREWQKEITEAPIQVYAAPSVKAHPKDDGTNSEAFILMDLSNREIVIGGSGYSGEIKKSVFSAMNYLLPEKGVLPMHAAANVGQDGRGAIFFGLSGTGKTTLSSDSSRKLIGDDEHGWGDDGIFNFEGGCYAKAIRLSQKAEPEIWDACHSFGTLLENVVMEDSTRRVDFNSQAITENTRAAYALSKIPNFEPSGLGGHPSAVIMLACDAFGVLPPVAKLDYEQAMYFFLSGYTAKVAGTEAGVTEPTSTFSACFGEPFMTRSPLVYSKLLGEKLRKHNVPCFLINTGWWKGPFGVGERMPISLSRALVNAALSGELEKSQFRRDETFGFWIPNQLSGVESSHLDMRSSWKDPKMYDTQARKLALMFIKNFESRYEGKVDRSVKDAGPRITE